MRPAVNQKTKKEVMKKIIVLSIALTLQGLTAFGQTNAVPPASQSAWPDGLQGQPGAARLGHAIDSVVSPHVTLSRNAEIQPVSLAPFRQIALNGSLAPEELNNDPGLMLETIFQPVDDQMADTRISDTIITIFPSRR
jgi:hypothetical protein